jgi:hypothetical protein
MNDFLKHILDSNSSFDCFAAGDKSETLAFTVNVYNKLNSGANDAELIELKKQLKEQYDQIEAFYKQHNGCKLYCHGKTCAIELFVIKNWKKNNKEWKQWFEDLEDEISDFQKEGIAFGEISDSDNYFIFYKGKVYYSDHDGGDDIPIGEDFNGFLSNIASDPAGFLMNTGYYTRYSDGETNKQWIPKIYQSKSM